MVRIDEQRMTRRVLVPETLEDICTRCRPRFRWLEGVKAALNSREMTVGAAQKCARDRMELRALVDM